MIPKQPQNYSLSWESPQEIRSYWGTINHWFPLIRPSKGLISWGGWHLGGQEFLHEMISLKTPGKPHKRLLFLFRSPTIYTCVYIYIYFFSNTSIQIIHQSLTPGRVVLEVVTWTCEPRDSIGQAQLLSHWNWQCLFENQHQRDAVPIPRHHESCKKLPGKKGSLSRGFFKQITWRQHRVDSLIIIINKK